MRELSLFWKWIITLLLIAICPFVIFFFLLMFLFTNIWDITMFLSFLIVPLIIPFIWIKKRRRYAIFYGVFLLCFILLIGTQFGIKAYKDSITIDVAPNIDVNEYLPFDPDSKIVKIESKTLNFEELPNSDLPIIDGATAAFPVYSAFVHAVYPDDTQLYEDIFQYNNTVSGYKALAERKTDIFIGAYPSQEQIEYAEKMGTSFEYTQIGYEAFVFFVHKDNPISSLTLEQIRGIYSGQITNWKQVGGNDEKIIPFQRNEGSGSQSMLIRLMGDIPIIEPDLEEQVDGMGRIIQEVADYKNKSGSIGFSFRYCVEGIIQNPDIKLIAIDGTAPSVQNIKNNTYPIVAPVYAVTYKDNPKATVYELISWITSDEGQYIIEKTGYVGISK